MVDKFNEDGLNTEIMSGVGFFLPFFAFHMSIGAECFNIWIQFPKLSYNITFTKTRKRLKELIDESTVFSL